MLKKMKNYLKVILPVIGRFNVPDMYSRSAEIAFYLTITIFPTLIFIICALAYIPGLDVLLNSKNFVQIVPKDALLIIQSIVNSAVENKSIELLIFSFLLATWTASKAVKSIIKGQNMAFGFIENRNFFLLNLISMVYAVGFFVMTILSIGLLVYGKKINIFFNTTLGYHAILYLLFNILRFLLPIVSMTYIFLNLFTLSPCGELKYRETLPGSIITTILWLIFSFFYSFYANYFNSSKQIYGNISTIIVLMTWLYFCSMSVTIGYKINAILYFQRKIEQKNSSSRVR